MPNADGESKKYKFIRFETVTPGYSYRIYNRKSNEVMGWINFYKPWKRPVFNTEFEFVWSDDCLADVIDFIKNEIPKYRKAGDSHGD